MSLTKEQLLIPRVMCVGTEPGTQNYPGSLFKTGDILYLEDSKYFYALYGGTDTCISNPKLSYHDAEKFPHLFRPMPWWEGRTVEDIPEYVIDKFGKVKRVLDYNTEFMTVVFSLDDFEESLAHYLPATEQEYNEYQKQKEGVNDPKRHQPVVRIPDIPGIRADHRDRTVRQLPVSESGAKN